MKRFLYLAAMATALAFPARSVAEITGEATLGAALADMDHESYKYGEYTGVSDDDIFLLGSADIGYYNGAYYLEFAAKDLGLENKSLLLKSGKFNGYNAFIGYSELPRLISNNSSTLFRGAGSDSLEHDITPQTGSQALDLSGLKDIKLSLERKKLAMGFSRRAGNLSYGIEFSREEKDGIKSIGGTVGTNGGNGRGVVLPEPVDYKTDELRANIGWEKNSSYARFEYLLSAFDNSTESLTWESLYTAPAATATGYARISLPPDNMHQRFSLSFGTSLQFLSTRINGVAEYGMMEQDEELLPWGIANTTALPRESAIAEIDTKALTLNISSRPAQRLGLNLKYRLYSTHNRMPRQDFRYFKNDSAAQVAVNDTVFSLPFDYTLQNLSLDTSWYLARATTLRAGYEHEAIGRDYRESASTGEDTVRASLQSSYIEDLSLGLKGSYGERVADGYDQLNHYSEYRWPALVASGLAASPQTAFDNNPYLRKSDQADRKRTTAGASATYFPAPAVAVSAFYDYTMDDYQHSVLGLQSSNSNRYTADVNLTLSGDISVYGFYTKEIRDTHQKSVSFTTKGEGNDSHDLVGNLWKAFHDDDIDTFGAGASMGFLEDSLVLKLDYSYAKSRSEISFEKGTDLTSTGGPMPALKTKLHSIGLTGTYRLNRNLSLGGGYRYENYESDDWQTEGMELDAANGVLLLSGPVEDYEAHQATIFATYHFGG